MRSVIAAALVSIGAASSAYAAPIEYRFSTGPNAFSTFGDFSGSSVSGTFLYDPQALRTNVTQPTDNPANAYNYGGYPVPGGFNSSFSALHATASGGALGAGYSFSDPRGLITVSNDGFAGSLPNGERGDFLGPSAEPFTAVGVHNIVPFSVYGETLWNMRIFWAEGQSVPELVPDFLNDQNLPAQLPAFHGRLALDFVPEGNTSGTPLSFVFYDSVSVSPLAAVPEPQSYAMLGAGLLLLGFAARRRLQNAREPLSVATLCR